MIKAPMSAPSVPAALPQRFANWFAGRGWAARPHQLAMIETAARPLSAPELLAAPDKMELDE